MKRILFISFIVLAACTHKNTITEQATDQVVARLEHLRENINDSGCPEQNKKQFAREIESLKAETKTIALACDTEKEVLREKLLRQKTFIALLLLVILAGAVFTHKFKR